MRYGTINIVALDDGYAPGLYAIQSGYFSRALVEACKAVPGMRFNKEVQWYGYPDAIECVQGLLALKGIRVEGKLPEPGAWREGDTALPAVRDDGAPLRPYQLEGIRFLIAQAREGCLLADGPRLGKSTQSIVAAKHFDTKTLVVCPPHVTGVWGRPLSHPKPGEVAKAWCNAFDGLDGKGERGHGPGVVILDSVGPAKWQEQFRKLSEIPEAKRSPEQVQQLKEANAQLNTFGVQLRNAKVVIAHDSIIYAWVEVLLRWGAETLILDEVHCFSSWDARRSIAVKEIARAAKQRMALSGTPMLNRPRDLHNVVDIICPGRFGVFFREEGSSFGKEFCDSHQKTVGTGPEAKTVWDHSGVSNPELLNRRLSYFMLRRVARDVDDQLPAVQRQIVDVRVPPTKTVMPSFETLRDKAHLRRLLDLAADGKLKQVVNLVKDHIEAQEKILVFCHRRNFAEAIVNGVRGFGDCEATFVHGELSSRVREQRIYEAENFTGPFVFAATIESCSTGIDLSFARVAIFAELTWEPADLAQAEARTYKLGSGSKNLIQYVIAKGTGDELILRSVIAKLDDFEKIVGTTGDGMSQDLSKKEKPEVALKRLGDMLLRMAKSDNPEEVKMTVVRKSRGRKPKEVQVDEVD